MTILCNVDQIHLLISINRCANISLQMHRSITFPIFFLYEITSIITIFLCARHVSFSTFKRIFPFLRRVWGVPHHKNYWALQLIVFSSHFILIGICDVNLDFSTSSQNTALSAHPPYFSTNPVKLHWRNFSINCLIAHVCTRKASIETTYKKYKRENKTKLFWE